MQELNGELELGLQLLLLLLLLLPLLFMAFDQLIRITLQSNSN
jgi:hypothetical protein